MFSRFRPRPGTRIFIKIRLTFEKVWILNIFIRVTLEPKITKSAKSIKGSSKGVPARGDQSAEANLALRNKEGAGSGAPNVI